MSALDLPPALDDADPVYVRVQWVHPLRGWACTMGRWCTPWPREALRLLPPDVRVWWPVGEQEAGRLSFVVAECQPACFVRQLGTDRLLVLESAADWGVHLRDLVGGPVWCYVMIDTRTDTWEGCK